VIWAKRTCQYSKYTIPSTQSPHATLATWNLLSAVQGM